MEKNNLYKVQNEIREIEESAENLRKAGHILANEVKNQILTIMGKLPGAFLEDIKVKESNGTEYSISGTHILYLEVPGLVVATKRGVYKFPRRDVEGYAVVDSKEFLNRDKYNLSDGEYLFWGDTIIRNICDKSQSEILVLERAEFAKSKNNL